MAYNPKLQEHVGRLIGTGIKLKITEKDTGKEVNYGVQFNNTTLEIEALPNLKVEIMQIPQRHCNMESKIEAKLGQLIFDGVTWAIAQEDSQNGKILVRFMGIDEYWNLSDIVEVEDRDIIKILKASYQKSTKKS